MIKIAIAQINPCVGDLKGNYQKIIENIKKAKKKKADIVVFGELILCGYPPEDLLLKPHFVKENIRYLNKIKSCTKGIAIIVGFVDKEGDEIYNSYAFIVNGKIKDIYHKVQLPNYGVFDEKRYFGHGDRISIYSFNGYNFSINICEDIWRDEYVAQLEDKNLDFLINISASPYHLGKIFLRRKVLSRASKRINCFLLYCHLVGGQDELVFDGTSMVFSPQGKLITYAKRFEEDFLIFVLNKKNRYSSKELRVSAAEEIFFALRLGLFDYVKKHNFDKVIVGVSGGIDSAVVVSLAALALGKNNVYALLMPSLYTSSETFNDAKKICRNLGLKYGIINIDEIFQSELKGLNSFFKKLPLDKTEENIQARIRGNLLMAFSNKFGYLVLNTGNKSEVSCGYCTLYGDMVGGFGILKDVSKTRVYKLAHCINRIAGRMIIPSSVIERPPSAELRPGQRDIDTLPSYSLLDPILKLYIEDELSSDEIIKKGFKKSLVRKVIKMVDANEYKRRQAPVGIKISPKAFGKDRRMPITNRFFK